MPSPLRVPGLVPALVGGISGGVVGVLLGNFLAEQVSAGDLSDIGTGLLFLLAGLLIGPSAGVTIALLVRNHDRALATGLVTGPFVALALIAGVLVAAPLSESDAGTFLFLPLVLAFVIAAIWLARWLTTR